METSPLYHAVYRAPWERRCGHHRAEDAMAQLKVSKLKAQGRQDGIETELTARFVGKPNDGAVLRASMAATAFVPGGDVPGDVDDEVALMLPSQRPMIFRDFDVEMCDRGGVLETADDNAVDHGSPSKCDKMPRDIVFRTHPDVLWRALSGDRHARKKPGAVRLQSRARVMAVKPPPKQNRLR